MVRSAPKLVACSVPAVVYFKNETGTVAKLDCGRREICASRLRIKVTDPAIDRLDLSAHFQVIGGNDFRIPDEWCEWRGIIRVEEVKACHLFIAAKLSCSTPDVLDGENIRLRIGYGHS